MNYTKAIVTGAGSGLGRAFCIELARRGVSVCAVDIQLQAAKETVSMLRGVEAFALECDVSKADAMLALRDEINSHWGSIDLLINNAGIAVGGRMDQISLKDWQRIFEVNVWGVLHGCHAFVPQMRKQKQGAILNVASVAGVISLPFLGAYSATKSTVISISETLYAELRSIGVHVSVLCPMFFKSNLINSKETPSDRLSKAIVKQMDQSSIQADDIARIAMNGLQSRRLYIFPHAQGYWAWRLKRIAPQLASEIFVKFFNRSLR